MCGRGEDQIGLDRLIRPCAPRDNHAARVRGDYDGRRGRRGGIWRFDPSAYPCAPTGQRRTAVALCTGVGRNMMAGAGAGGEFGGLTPRLTPAPLPDNGAARMHCVRAQGRIKLAWIASFALAPHGTISHLYPGDAARMSAGGTRMVLPLGLPPHPYGTTGDRGCIVYGRGEDQIGLDRLICPCAPRDNFAPLPWGCCTYERRGDQDGIAPRLTPAPLRDNGGGC